MFFKKPCVKCSSKTRNEFEGKIICLECEESIRFSRDPAKRCPEDRTVMKKETVGSIIIDRCPKCGGVWLDQGELEAIQEWLDSGSSGFATGLATGMAMGQIIN